MLFCAWSPGAREALKHGLLPQAYGANSLFYMSSLRLQAAFRTPRLRLAPGFRRLRGTDAGRRPWSRTRRTWRRPRTWRGKGCRTSGRRAVRGDWLRVCGFQVTPRFHRPERSFGIQLDSIKFVVSPGNPDSARKNGGAEQNV